MPDRQVIGYCRRKSRWIERDEAGVVRFDQAWPRLRWSTGVTALLGAMALISWRCNPTHSTRSSESRRIGAATTYSYRLMT